jgi:hypothetical protein
MVGVTLGELVSDPLEQGISDSRFSVCAPGFPIAVESRVPSDSDDGMLVAIRSVSDGVSPLN